MFNKMLVIVFAVIATILMCANMTNAQVVTEGLVSYWTFDKTDTDGDDYVDFGVHENLNLDPPLTVSMFINNKDEPASFIWQGGEKSGSTKNYIYVRNDGGINVGQWPPD